MKHSAIALTALAVLLAMGCQKTETKTISVNVKVDETKLKEAGIRLYAAHLEGEKDYEAEDYTKASGFLIGNEANGLTEETAALADAWVRIPMAGKVESLNAAVAASVLLFETARQRRQ